MKFPAIIRPLSQVARPPRKFGAGSDANVPGVRNRLTTSAIAFNEARNWCFLRAFRVSGRLTGNYYLSSSWPGRLPNGNFRVAGQPTGALSHSRVTDRTVQICLGLSNVFAPRLPEERFQRVVPANCDATPPEAQAQFRTGRVARSTFLSGFSPTLDPSD